MMTSACARRKCSGNDGAIGTEPAAPIVPTRVTGTPSTISSTVDGRVWNASTRLASRPSAIVHNDWTTRSIPPGTGG